ncbi:MAG: hypothetical protein HYW48_10695, partial [Deltaproteobacteria bacterium]|nr:hypothetical protein [Deltaproteobacteria bacterium]
AAFLEKVGSPAVKPRDDRLVQEELFSHVIPRLDRGIQRQPSLKKLDPPRASRGMTDWSKRNFFPTSSRGLTAGSNSSLPYL